MAYAGGDRIKEFCNTPGTGSFVLQGVVIGEIVRAFSAAEDGQYLRYLAKHFTAAEAEIGAGLYTHGTRTLTRLHRSYPTEGAGAVAFSSGVVHVAVTPSVRDVMPFQSTSDPTINDDVADGHLRGNKWINTTSGAVFVCVNPAPGAAVWNQINTVGTAGTIATQGEAEAGASNIVYMSPLRTEQHHAARQAIASTGFNPTSVLIDDDRQYTDTYNQVSTAAFEKAVSGTFRRDKVLQVTFNSNGSAITWTEDFEALALGAPLPSVLPVGLHTLALSWHSGRAVIQVAWASLLTEGAILKDYSELSPSATVTGSITRSFADGNVQRLTLSGNVTALAISNPPPAGEVGTITFILTLAGFTWAHPTGVRHADATPPTLSGRCYVTYITDNAGTNWDCISGGKAFA